MGIAGAYHGILKQLLLFWSYPSYLSIFSEK